jgi:SH3-like domain-containing protein
MEIQEKQAPENIEGLIEENLKPEAKPVQEPGKKVSIRVDVADVYTDPSVNSKVKIQAFMGEHYKMTDWSPKGWLKLELNDGSTGWIPTVMIRPVSDGEKQPKVEQVVRKDEPAVVTPSKIQDVPLKEGEESPKERQPVAEDSKDESFAPVKDNQAIKEIQVLITTIKKANIRSGPAPSFEVKRVEDAGVRFKSTGVISDEWYRIQMEDGSIGWIHKSVISVLTGV